MLGSLILYLKAMRIAMLQLSGLYCRENKRVLSAECMSKLHSQGSGLGFITYCRAL